MTSPSKSYLLSNPEHFERESKRLEIQAEGMLNRELAAISNFSSCKAKVVLDLGCGNGFALELISEKLKGAIVHGIDRNPALIEQAKQNCTRAEFSCIDLTDIERLATAIKTISPDLIFLRYVVQHLSKNEYISLFSTLLINKGPSATVIIVDTDDRLCSFSPASPDAMALLEAKQRLQNHEGGDRTIGSNLLAPLTEIGYAFVERNGT
jgi:trans-aconitate methyltransferase